MTGDTKGMTNNQPHAAGMTNFEVGQKSWSESRTIHAPGSGSGHRSPQAEPSIGARGKLYTHTTRRAHRIDSYGAISIPRRHEDA